MVPQKHTAANPKQVPWNPIPSNNVGINFIIKNEKTDKSIMQNDTQMSLIFSIIISGTIVVGKVRIPSAEMNMTNEKLVTGIQLRASTSKFQDRSIMYTPSVIRPKVAPIVEETSNSWKEKIQLSITYFWRGIQNLVLYSSAETVDEIRYSTSSEQLYYTNNNNRHVAGQTGSSFFEENRAVTTYSIYATKLIQCH